jgi:hypothetical protein
VENLVQVAAGLFLAWMFIDASQPLMERYLGIPQMDYKAFDWQASLALLMGLPFVTTLYPFWKHVHKAPITSMQSVGAMSRPGVSRDVFLFLQYIITSTLALFALYFISHLNYILHTDMGYNTRNIVTVTLCSEEGINNIRNRKPLPVYGKGENVRDWLFVEDHARAIDLIFHEGKVAETYNIGGFNEWKNIDLIKVMIRTVDRILGNPEGSSLGLITYVTDRLGHDARYAIDSTKLQKELGWEPSLQFEEGIEKTVRWYLDNQEWMDNITSGEYEKYYEDMYKGR